MTAKHTPCPWRLFTTGDGTKFISIGDICAEYHRGFEYGIEAEEADANACLMAAAPDMFEALEGLLDACDELEEVYNQFMVDKDAMAAARAALAKAKGENS